MLDGIHQHLGFLPRHLAMLFLASRHVVIVL